MKKRLSILIPVGAFLLMTIAFSACKKTVNNNTHVPAAGLMAFNLAPDSTSVGFSVGGDRLTTTPLGFTEYTGKYLGVSPRTQDISVLDFSSGAKLATTSQLFADSAYYSAFFVGTAGNYKNIIVKDNFDSLSSTSGQAYVRYVNAIPDSSLQPNVTIASGGTNVIDTTSTFSTVSDFKGITPGDITINVSAETSVNANRTISVEQGKIYTILLVGSPTATDSTKAVQIKFIQNGQVTP